MIDREGRNVLLIKKARPTWQAGRLNVIGGKIEEGESPLEAMCREKDEEVGGTWRPRWEEALILTGTSCGKEVYIVHFFRAFTTFANLCSVAGKQTNGEIVGIYEIGKLYYPPLDQKLVAQGACIPNLKWILPMLCDPNVDRARVFEGALDV